MRLSTHFTLAEMTTTSTGIANNPPQDVLTEMVRLCRVVLEHLRAEVGRPLQVTSGYRSPEVNAAVGGSATSQHLKGQAADVKPLGVDRLVLWGVVLANLDDIPIDQAIIYEETGHVHVSTSPSPRRDALVKVAGSGYVRWEDYSGPLK
jgi:uncharacterized protein YcbK (DUF882 family)